MDDYKGKTGNMDLSAEQPLIREQSLLIQSQAEKLRRLEEAYQLKCAEYNDVINSKAWKMTAPLRFGGNVIKWMLGLQPPGYSPWQVLMRHSGRRNRIARSALFSRADLRQQRNHIFEKDVKISIVVPLFNTPETYLREMIQSVLAQTYAHWELCMADGSDAPLSRVERICREYEKQDNRIRYLRLKRNEGISANTNAALAMASGDYVGLLDHDDQLHPAALYEVMKAICDQDADLIYTDEAHFHSSPKDADNPHFKPDFAPDTLCANNYICHFTVFRRSLTEQCGFFETECDGSQDHDMILRLSEKAQRISHIPEVLYYWREHPNSVASNLGIKPYVFEAGVHANRRRLKRLGIRGKVSMVHPGSPIYRIRYEITGKPCISVIIRADEDSRIVFRLIQSVLSETRYRKYEIIILEKKNLPPEAEAAYKRLRDEHDNLKVIRMKKRTGDSLAYNEAVRQCSGDDIVILNVNMMILTPGWLEEMLMYCQQPGIGAVGAKILNPDQTIRHAGIGLGMMQNTVGWFFQGVGPENGGYMGRLVYAQNVSAVAGGCVMLSRKAWQDVNGMDEAFSGDWGVIDLCLRLRRAGYLNVWTPFAELTSYESGRKTRDSDEENLFRERWKKELEAGDPYFNPNFAHEREDFLPDVRPGKHAARCVINRRLLNDAKTI